MSNFQTLLEELAAEERLMAKSMRNDDNDDDEDIRNLADGDGGGDEDEDDKDQDDYDDEPMTKAMRVKLPDGSEVEAYDGTAMVKSLQAKVASLQQGSHDVVGQMATLVKSLSATVRAQAKEMKDLRKSLNILSGQGTGRRSTARAGAADRNPDAQPSLADVKDQLMAKAMTAFDAKKITGLEMNTIDVALRRGQFPDQHILDKIA